MRYRERLETRLGSLQASMVNVSARQEMLERKIDRLESSIIKQKKTKETLEFSSKGLTRNIAISHNVPRLRDETFKAITNCIAECLTITGVPVDIQIRKKYSPSDCSPMEYEEYEIKFTKPAEEKKR